MKTHESTSGWKKYLTSSFLLFLLAVILLVTRSYFAIQDNIKINNLINKTVIIKINDEIILNEHKKSDTIDIYVNSHDPNIVEIVDSLGSTTITLDSTGTYKQEKLW